MQIIEEIKVHKNKETQRFRCSLLHREAGYLVLFYRAEQPGRIKDIVIPRGSITIAHYWADRGYVLWRMYGPDSSLIGTLFHICRDVTITETSVQYLDLIIDIWIPADGEPRVLDEDELEECRQQGLVSNEEKQWIEEQKNIILDNTAEILKGLWTATN
jgi:predicted RNA-binding protein associated with RNAse of E/G family